MGLGELKPQRATLEEIALEIPRGGVISDPSENLTNGRTRLQVLLMMVSAAELTPTSSY